MDNQVMNDNEYNQSSEIAVNENIGNYNVSQTKSPRLYLFKDNTFRTRFAQTLFVLSLPLWGAAIFSGIWEHNLLNDIKYDRFASEEEMRVATEFSDMLLTYVGLGQLISTILTIIFFMMWIHRSNNNARALTGEPMEYTPGWSVGWFFVPIANLWKPYKGIKQIWQVCARNLPSDYQGICIVGIWWGFWLTSSIIGQAAVQLEMEAEEIDSLIIANAVSTASDVVDIISKIFTFLLITKLFSMQQEIREHQQSNTFSENWC